MRAPEHPLDVGIHPAEFILDVQENRALRTMDGAAMHRAFPRRWVAASADAPGHLADVGGISHLPWAQLFQNGRPRGAAASWTIMESVGITAGACGGGVASCECEADADCAPYDSENLCTARLKCDTELAEPVCVLDPATIVTCTQPESACKVSECNPETGVCEENSAPDGTACDAGDPCTAGDFCEAGACQPGDQNICACPAGMVAVGESHCIDQYEASRSDATGTQRGGDNSRATIRVGVLFWMPIEYAQGRAACQASGKRLCTPDEFDRGDGASWYAGGAFNCIDSEQLHQCGSIQKNINARGFRCCADYGTGTAP